MLERCDGGGDGTDAVYMHGYLVRESRGEPVGNAFAAVEELAVESHDALGM